MEMEVLLASSDPAKAHPSKPARSFREQDFDAHRQVYVGVHMPMKSTQFSHSNSASRRTNGVRPKQNRQYQLSQKKKKQLVFMTKHTDDSASEEEGHDIPPASERVRFILGAINEKDENEKDTHDRHELFTELEEFVTYEDGDEEWKETARWFKYEEDVEEGGDRWSKPHVATLSLHSLFEVRSCLMSGTVILDMEADNMSQIADLVLDHLISCNRLEESARVRVRDTLLRRHRHQRSAGLRKGLSNIMGNRKPNNINMNGQRKGSSASLSNHDKPIENGVHTSLSNGKRTARDDTLPPCPSMNGLQGQNKTSNNPKFSRSASVPGHLVYQERQPPQEEVSDKLSGFMKKLPANSEASNVLVGEVDFLIKPITAFIRLHKGVILGDLTEVPIPTRFLFIMMGPALCPGKYHEIGRSISTLMADEVFHDVAYLAKKRDDLIAGIDEFLEKVTVLPPGEWDPSIRIEPPLQTPTNETRRQTISDPKKLTDNHSLTGVRTGNSSDNNDEEDGLAARYFMTTKQIFGGLKQDFQLCRQRIGDLSDAFSFQCIGSVCFTYIIMLALILVYGELYRRNTGSTLNGREHLLALSINGILHAMFGGQPLVMLGFTFPLIMFDTVLYKICQLAELDFLPFRMWIGMWTAVFLLIFVAFGVSVYIRYFTRFALEIFVAAVAVVVLYNAFSSVADIKMKHPVLTPYDHESSCACVVYISKTINSSTPFHPTVNPMSAANNSNKSGNPSNATVLLQTIVTKNLDVSFADCIPSGGTLVGLACDNGVYFLSLILALSSVLLVSLLAMLRVAGYFPTFFRRLIGDFATLITVLVMSAIAYSYRNEVNLSYLTFPDTYHPSESSRNAWMVETLGSNPIWVVVVACIPAICLTMTLFLEQHLTTMIANKKENKLKKPYGYHLDLLIMMFGVLVSSIFGLPFTVGSAVITVNHIQSLYIDCAEYQRAKVKGVREQRLTSLGVFILLVFSPMINPILRYVPKSVLFGILVFAGFRTLNNVQFIERMRVMALPPKNQPDLIYLRQVPTFNVYLYTIIQLLCVFMLWAVRMTYAAVLFPVAMIMVMLLRFLLSKLFRTHHLVVLDEAIPKSLWQQKLLLVKEQLLQDLEKGVEDSDDGAKSDDMVFDFLNCKPTGLLISEELVKMPVWQKLIREESSPPNSIKDSPKSTDNNRKRRRRHTRKKTEQSKSPSNIEEAEIHTSKEEEINLPAPWDLPYQSPPRTDSKFLAITEYEVNVDPACSRTESKSATGEETKSDDVYS